MKRARCMFFVQCPPMRHAGTGVLVVLVLRMLQVLWVLRVLRVLRLRLRLLLRLQPIGWPCACASRRA